MKRTAILAIAVALSVAAQTKRDAYRDAYRVWRESDPTLERDVAAGGATLSKRADQAGAQAAKYGAERSTFLQQLIADQGSALSWLERGSSDDPQSALPRNLDRILTSETNATAHYIEIYAKDQDPGIQQLRQAFERERSALAALSAAIGERQKAGDAAKAAASAAEQVLQTVLDQNNDVLDGLKRSMEQNNTGTSAWAQYYRTLAEGAQRVITEEAPLPNLGPGAVPVNPAPRPQTPAVTPLPLARYTGAWTLPETNRLFHGVEPATLDLVVKEENGRASGTLVGRFKLPPGGGGDPVVRFSFSGDFKPTRNQVLDLVTSDGSKGTIELIPGPAFNLLEINFHMDPKPGKVTQANVILIKQ
jgi:hypothetical protein